MKNLISILVISIFLCGCRPQKTYITDLIFHNQFPIERISLYKNKTFVYEVTQYSNKHEYCGKWTISSDTLILFFENNNKKFLIEESKITEFEMRDKKILLNIAYLKQIN